jgi:hypothetical protein
MNAPATILHAIGQPYAGGILLGRFFVAEQSYALIGAPKAELRHLNKMRWNDDDNNVAGALSVYDGLANTRAMTEAGSKLAKAITELRIDDRDDWYLPSRGEALLAYAADLKSAEAVERDWYWTSTQYAGVPSWAWCQSFDTGDQTYSYKDGQFRVFAVRREPIL